MFQNKKFQSYKIPYYQTYKKTTVKDKTEELLN